MVLVNKQQINIQDVLDGLCQIFEYQFEEQDCHISFNLEVPMLFADPELFQRAVYNLVLNALVHGAITELSWLQVNIRHLITRIW